MEHGNRASRMVPWGVAAVAGAIVLDLGEDLIDPANTGTASKVFEAAAQQHGRMIASALLLLATAICVVPGVAGLARLPADRGRRLGRVAAALALLGGLGHAALAAIYLVWAAIPGDGATQAQLIDVVDRINSSSWLAALAPLFFAFPLSLVALFGALVRARIAPRWILVPVAAAPVVSIVGQSAATASTAVALVLLLVALAAVSLRILDWERRPRTTTWVTGNQSHA